MPAVPPPPGRFSNKKGCPIWDPAGSSTVCATVSLVEPAANGLTTKIGRVGHSSAADALATTIAMRLASAVHSLCLAPMRCPLARCLAVNPGEPKKGSLAYLLPIKNYLKPITGDSGSPDLLTCFC